MKITIGLPVNYTWTLADYDAGDGYSISGQLVDSAGTSHELTSPKFSGSGTSWTLTLSANTPTTLTDAGDYTLYLIAEKSGEVDQVAAQIPVTVEALGTISHAQQMVTALRALMVGASTKDYASLTTVDGESITRLKPEERVKWLAYYEKRLAAERATANGTGTVKTIETRFV